MVIGSSACDKDVSPEASGLQIAKAIRVLITVLSVLFSNTALALSSDDCRKISDSMERLGCYDRNATTIVEPAPNAQTWETAIDSHLALTLKDPASVKQYQVTSKFACNGLAESPSGDCACWSANAKNSYGAYAGSVSNIVTLRCFSEFVCMVETSAPLSSRGAIEACSNAGYKPRDVQLIVAQAK